MWPICGSDSLIRKPRHHLMGRFHRGAADGPPFRPPFDHQQAGVPGAILESLPGLGGTNCVRMNPRLVYGRLLPGVTRSRSLVLPNGAARRIARPPPACPAPAPWRGRPWPWSHGPGDASLRSRRQAPSGARLWTGSPCQTTPKRRRGRQVRCSRGHVRGSTRPRQGERKSLRAHSRLF